MKHLSALILTYNEEDNIADCLDSINWIDRIVVVDSYSDDLTEEICQQYDNVDFYKNEFKDFASQRNFGLDKIETDWVFVIDADERVTEELKHEIKSLNNTNEAEAFNIIRKNYFLGKWIKYCGWHPDYNIRLFKSKYRYKGLVHEGFYVDGKTEKLEHGFNHYTFNSTKKYAEKLIQYADLGAQKDYNSGKKINYFYILIRPFVEFIKLYIFKKGFLAGGQGLILSLIMSYYKFLKYSILWEKNNN